MIKLYLFSIFLVTTNLFFSQDFIQKWSTPVIKSVETKIVDIQSDQDEIILFIKHDKEKNYLRFDRYDTLAQFIESVELRVDAQEVYKMFAVNNEIVVFCVDNFDDEKIDELSVNVYTRKGEKVLSKVIFSQPSNGGYRNQFDVNVSPNGQFFGASCSEAFNEKLNETLHIKLLDRSLEQIQKKDILTTLLSDKKRVNITVVNNQGNVFILKKYKIKMDNYYMIYAVDKNGVESKTDLKLRVKKIADFLYTFDQEGNLILGGFFSTIGKINFEGVFAAKFAPNLQNVYLKEYMLPENVIGAFKSKKEIETYGNGLDNFRVSKFQFVNENQLSLIAEHISAYTDPKEGYRDYRKGVVAISLTAEGGYLYGAPILTDQQDAAHRGYWSSFNSFVVKDELVITHNTIGPAAKKLKTTETNSPLYISQYHQINGSGVIKSAQLDWTCPIKNAAALGEISLDLPTFKIVLVEQESKNQYILGKLITKE